MGCSLRSSGCAVSFFRIKYGNLLLKFGQSEKITKTGYWNLGDEIWDRKPVEMRGIGEINENKINKFKKMAMAGIAPICLKSDSDKILAGGLAKGSSASRGGARRVRLHRS